MGYQELLLTNSPQYSFCSYERKPKQNATNWPT